MNRPAAGDRMFLHRLQHRRLGLGCGTVDFIGQDNLPEHRPRLELKRPPAGGRVFQNNMRANNIRRHQIRRKLDAAKRQRQRRTQRPHQQRLTQPRHPFQQHVSSGKQTDQHIVHNGLMSYDHLADFRCKRFKRTAKLLTLFLHFLYRRHTMPPVLYIMSISLSFLFLFARGFPLGLQ